MGAHAPPVIEKAKRCSIRGSGTLQFKNDIQLVNGKSVSSLLKSVACRFAKKSHALFLNMGIYPPIYTEKVLTSVLLPSFSESASSVVVEFPARRFERRPRSSARGRGYLDYWVWNRDDALVVEAKLLWVNLGSGSRLTKYEKQVWEDSKRQVDSIDTRTLLANTRGDRKPSRSFRVPLVIVAFWATEGERENDEEKGIVSMLQNAHKRLLSLDPRPNWMALWTPPDELQKSNPCGGEENDPRKYVYPAVGVYSYVHV